MNCSVAHTHHTREQLFVNIEAAVDAAFERDRVADLGVHDRVQVSSHQFEQAVRQSDKSNVDLTRLHTKQLDR